MKRWLPWFVIPAIMAVWIVLSHGRAGHLLNDSDTAVLLRALKAQPDFWAWFKGDWPLFNHFYRPISTLPFQTDLALYGDWAPGYGRTNALIAAACLLLFFWLVRELTESPLITGLSTILFGLYHISYGVLETLGGLLWIVAFGVWFGLARGGKAKFWTVLSASFGCVFLASILIGPVDFRDRVVYWLPGRTASTMMLFVLISMAAYARYERLTAGRLSAPDPTATDLPATKGTEVAKPGRAPWLWLGVSFVGVALSLGAYEQAVMLPAILLGIAIFFRCNRRLPHWGVHVGFWALLVGYFVLRRALVPSEVSGYQAQQFRDGPGLFFSLLEWSFPAGNNVREFLHSMDVGILLFLTAAPWTNMIGLGSNVTTMISLWTERERWLGIAALLMAFFSYLPMAWLKYFGHYVYWPSAMWALFVVVVGIVVMRQVGRAFAPAPIQAPGRVNPAPGSLPSGG
ncbi:MAG: hypothetical protein LCH41_10985 [Armatimonadetes bacterium]|nr:hypothetical protein [Armatimonadota bacterium]